MNELIKTGTTDIESYAVNLEKKLQFCQVLLQTGLLPQNIKTAQQAFTIIIYGQELGFSPMQSLQCIDVIQGKPCVNAAGLQAKMLAYGAKIEIVENSETDAKLKVTRGEVTNEFDFSIIDADKMGLLSKDNWKRMPKDMLYARAISRAARRMFADVTKGMLYETSEMKDAINVTPEKVIEITESKDEVARYFYYNPEKFTEEDKKQAAIEYLKNAEIPKNALDVYVSETPIKRLSRCELTESEIEHMYNSLGAVNE